MLCEVLARKITSQFLSFSKQSTINKLFSFENLTFAFLTSLVLIIISVLTKILDNARDQLPEPIIPTFLIDPLNSTLVLGAL